MKNIELDEEDLTLPVAKPPTPVVYNITRVEALKFLQRQVHTYEQFIGFPPSHPSVKALNYTGAIYRYILKEMMDK